MKETNATTRIAGLSWPERSLPMSAVLFCLFLLVFLLLPSKHYMAVDGSVRSVDVFFSPRLQLHGNNHMLYPLWVALWAKLCAAAGIRAANAFEYIRITEAMNSVLSAAITAMVYLLLSVFSSRWVATLCALLFGLSTASLLHATNAAEPVAGLFFSMLGITLLAAGLQRENRALWIAAGVSFALALASYEATGLVAGLGVFVALWWAAAVRRPGDVPRFAARTLLWVCLGGVLGICAVYGPAYAYEGLPARSMPREFVSLGGAPEIYSGFSVSRVVNLPFGLIRNLYGGLPADYVGARSLLREPQRAIWIPAVLAGFALLAFIAFLAVQALRFLARRAPRSVTIAGLTGCLLLIFPLLYWDPMYDKLWLLPLVAIVVIFALSLFPGALPTGKHNLLAGLLVGLLGLQIAFNIPALVSRHVTPAPYLGDAEAISKLVRPNDRLVIDFDDISSLWETFWGNGSQYLLLPASTKTKASDWLSKAKQDCRRDDCRILFIGVLDHDRAAWDTFLGARLGIPFGMLDEYRKASVLRSFPMDNGTVTIRAYRP
jgi:hypothetical protein